MVSISVGVIILVALSLISISWWTLRRTLSGQVADRTAQVASVVEGQLQLRQRDIEHVVELWSTNEQFRSDVHNEQWDAVEKSLGEILKARKLDVGIVLDSEGKISAVSGVSRDKAAAFASAHARAKLEHGAPQSLIEPIGESIYIVGCQKIDYFGNERGELVLFEAFNDALASDIQKKIDAQVIAFTATGPKASSFKTSTEIVDPLTRTFGRLPAKGLVTIGSTRVNEESYFIAAFALATSPNARVEPTAVRAAIAFAIPEKQIAQAQRKTLINSVVPAVLLTLLFGAAALALANQIARPISAMAEQFSRISASGDLSLRVQENLENEIGDMARSFNGMQQRVEQLHGRVVVAEERMRKELQMASTVQDMLFQKDMPHNGACEVAAYTSTLTETSGDWYAVFDDLETKRTIFVVLDATGHGASAALLTAITHGFFQTMWTARQGGDAALSRIPPSTILSMLNSVVLNSAHGTITATAFVGVLHHGTRKMVYSSAGHNPPIVARWGEDGEMKANILTCNPSSSIGSADKPVYEDYTVELPPSAIVLAYTDGLTEVENPAGMQWGVRKLITVLRGCRTDTVEGVRQKLLDSCMQFARGKELMDDMTYLTIRIL
ncbi:MAG: SpoIIE family protein phosphatase [Polyangia bacterium]